MQIVNIDPKDCKQWELADRSLFEFGNLSTLAEDIKRNGQIEPILVRSCKNDTKYKYEVIAGARRWRACFEFNLPFVIAIVGQMSDKQAAVAQIKENQKLPICDYSKGIYYAKLLKAEQMTQGELAANLGCSKSKLKNFLSFAKVPQEIWQAVTNMSKVSARTAQVISRLANKGKSYTAALIELAEEIRSGIGAKSLEKAVDSLILGISEPIHKQERILSLPSGTIIATWKDNALHFSNNIDFKQEQLAEYLINFFIKH